MEYITNCNALIPAGHYSCAVIHNDLIYISGQFSVDSDTGEKKFGSVEEETIRVLNNIALILAASGSDKEHVLKATVFIPDISQWNKVNKIYSDFFGEHKPARSIVPTKELHFGFKVEIEVIAIKK